MSIYKFGNNTYPWRIRRRSNLGHIFWEKKCVLWAGKCGNLLFHSSWKMPIFYWNKMWYSDVMQVRGAVL